ncbi:MAG: RIP metalloprotease RseP [Bacilli bacterium]|nr:RIP metalloprotease RseP [Bacilli bacterium]
MTLIYFILILGLIVFIHELGHFIFAKKAGIYCYEFSIGMGPKIFGKKFKSETEYCIRAIPLGGFVSMAGETVEEDKNIPKNKQMQSKTWLQRFLTIFAGPFFNFVLAFILLFLIGIIFGAPSTKPIIGAIQEDSAAYEAGLETGDRILRINDKKVSNWDQIIMKLQLNNDGSKVNFEVQKENGVVQRLTVKPKKIISDDQTTYQFGVGMEQTKYYGFVESLKYAASKLGSLTESMFTVIGGLFTGKISLNNISGPVGIYSIVGDSAKAGFDSVLYLIAYLSINVGFINLIPFPAFDGGRILFLIIEKIKGSPVSPKVENMMHNIGFFLLIGLMILVTFSDILRLF